MTSQKEILYPFVTDKMNLYQLCGMDRINQLLEFLKENPQDAFLIHALALEYQKNGNKEEALNWFLKNKMERPEYVATYFHLGKLYESMGNLKAAQETFAEGIVYAEQAGDAKTAGELRLAHEFVSDEPED